MLKFGKLCLNHGISRGANASTCCPPCPPPPPPQCGCGKSPGKRIQPPCKGGARPRIPPNPCVPRFPHGNWKMYRNLALLMIPVIAVQAMRALGAEHPHKQPCRDYEYMRIRNKRFPWGTGQETFFHNEHVNHLPGECEPPPLDCD